MPLGLIATKWHLTHVTFDLLLYMIFATIIITIYDICHRLFLGFWGVFFAGFFKSYKYPLKFISRRASEAGEEVQIVGVVHTQEVRRETSGK